MDSTGVQSTPPKLLCLERTIYGYVFKVRVRVFLRFGLCLGLRFSRDVVCMHLGLGI